MRVPVCSITSVRALGLAPGILSPNSERSIESFQRPLNEGLDSDSAAAGAARRLVSRAATGAAGRRARALGLAPGIAAHAVAATANATPIAATRRPARLMLRPQARRRRRARRGSGARAR